MRTTVLPWCHSGCTRGLSASNSSVEKPLQPVKLFRVTAMSAANLLSNPSAWISRAPVVAFRRARLSVQPHRSGVLPPRPRSRLGGTRADRPAGCPLEAQVPSRWQFGVETLESIIRAPRRHTAPSSQAPTASNGFTSFPSSFLSNTSWSTRKESARCAGPDSLHGEAQSQ
jgi:hypothetical protein